LIPIGADTSSCALIGTQIALREMSDAYVANRTETGDQAGQG
jgi:hypothetical protein